ncbi:DUF3116 family protein [Listeria seeligeri]|uniref:DUF3116 family protein n=1 Tax=Listeria seeligeri TaxID=1640 RepID=UPI001888B21F|nr:DUF3116 family protein [Listeria seeligeri]MBF2454767.1 DUF3116 family protein [Listeria seeligeri]MBF2670362.1 DUF3116 family protein [Listeria seeligeri]
MLPECEMIYSILAMIKGEAERVFDLTKNDLLFAIYWLEENEFVTRKVDANKRAMVTQKYFLTELGEGFISYY